MTRILLALAIAFGALTVPFAAMGQERSMLPPASRESVATGPAAMGRRVALVIGNSDYKNAPRLENPKNDAADVSSSLKKIGFQVIDGNNLDKAAMDRTIRDFAESLAGAKAALLFYAGHGLQVGGQNYLVPVDAKLTTAAALDFEMVRLDLIHRTMERETSTNIIILDACRDNPLARNLARALGTRSTQIGRGLAAVESGEGTLISFSTQPGNVALDGTGRNSPYAQALLTHISEPGLDLPSILINVRNDVMRLTERRQVPWEHSALTAKFYFVPPSMTVEQQMEATYWDAVKLSTVPGPIASYIERYPSGANVALARALIDQLEKQELAQRARHATEQHKLEAELKRLEEARKAAETQRVEALRKADEMRKNADAALTAKPSDKQAGSNESAPVQAELARRDEQLKAANEALHRARQETEALEAKKAAAEKAAADAMKAAEASKAAVATEAKRRGETQLAAIPPTRAVNPSAPFDGQWVINARSANCMVKNGTGVFTVTGGRLEGKRKGSISPTGHAEWTQPAATDGAAVEFRGTFRGNSGSGSYARADGRCNGTFTATRH